ncbi:tetratricopeptide repeat protein [uncultured Acetobacteroides sp.]|uniref:tetratricopeptide repeat protein n=1 Tax=uncultured Acetobacteroides sp. TaxID=1760811 RepID=UPI0029F4D34F|nr:tetratricopeptide repeat protein [uncultured Acetobacteroides sp.]
MKKFTFAIALAFAFNLGFAQKDYSPESVKAKAEKSNYDIADTKAGASYKTWLKRAEVFGEISEAPLAGAYPGMSDKEADLLIGKPTTTSNVEVNGKALTKMEYPYVDLFFEGGKLLYWNIKNSGVEKPLVTGFEAIEKAISLDPKASKKAKDLYTTYKSYFFKKANNAYNASNKAEAAENYGYAYQCSANQSVNAPDTASSYYAAYAFIEASNFNQAIKYAQICLDNKCNQNGDVYRIIGEAYMGEAKDTVKNPAKSKEAYAKSKEAYLKGSELYPSNTANIFGIINLYISQNEDPKNVLPYIDKAIGLDPKNPSLFFVKASFYEKINEPENAIASYNKAIELNPKYFEGWCNLGVVYYNIGVKYYDQSNKVDVNNQKEYDRLIKLGDENHKIALQKFLQAYSINPKDKFVVENIKNIYFRFRNESEDMKKKCEEFTNILQSL